MNNVYFPVRVVVLFRRLVDMISALSISTQLTTLGKEAPSHIDRSTTNAQKATANCENHPLSYSWKTFEALHTVEWPWWTFPESWYRAMVGFGGVGSVPPQRTTLKAMPGISFPWFNTGWSWPSFTSRSSNTTPWEGPDLLPEGKQRRRRATSPRSAANSASHSKLFPFQEPVDIIHNLLQNPALYDPIRSPRYPIVLCHGLYGFDVRGPESFPSLRMHYWSNVLSILRKKVGAEVIVTSVPGTGSIASRSETLHRQLQDRVYGRAINFLAHSMGGLDCRHLISHIKPTQYGTLSLTTISTPHRGSPFMDWCVDNIGIGKLREKESLPAELSVTNISSDLPPSISHPVHPSPNKADTPFTTALPSSFTTLLLSIVDSPAYANLTTAYLTRVFNPLTPDDPRVRYFSVAGRVGGVSVWHPLWLPKMVLDSAEGRARAQLREDWEREQQGEQGEYEVQGLGVNVRAGERPLWMREDDWGNDGLVTVQSARWGEFLGTLEGCDHWAMRGARGIELGVDLKAVNGDGWMSRDWSRLVGAWRREERMVEVVSGNSGQRSTEREQERADEALIKSSTDKLSAVFDWLVDQVPAPRLSLKGRADSETEDGGVRGVGQIYGERKELGTKMDLERFYVALSRKLYDEGF